MVYPPQIQRGCALADHRERHLPQPTWSSCVSQPSNQLTLCFAPNRQLGPPVVEPPLLAVDAQALDDALGRADAALPPLSSGSPSAPAAAVGAAGCVVGVKQTAAHITKRRSMIGQVRLKLRVIAGGTAVAAAVEVQQMSRLVVAGVKEKRNVYTDEQKTTPPSSRRCWAWSCTRRLRRCAPSQASRR